jgi:hypothetical protein
VGPRAHISLEDLRAGKSNTKSNILRVESQVHLCRARSMQHDAESNAFLSVCAC